MFLRVWGLISLCVIMGRLVSLLDLLLCSFIPLEAFQFTDFVLLMQVTTLVNSMRMLEGQLVLRRFMRIMAVHRTITVLK